MASSVVKKQALGFMDLPGEVRNMIYPHLLSSPLENRSSVAAPPSTSSSSATSLPSVPNSVQSNTETNGNNAVTASSDEVKEGRPITSEKLKTKKTKPHPFYPAILATNRCINAEATLFLYTLNAFTVTVTSSSLQIRHSPPLLSSTTRHLHHTRSWTVVIDLVASAPESWAHPERDYRETICEGRDLVDEIKAKIRKVCRALELLRELETVRIEIVSDYSWQLRSRLAGLGLVRLLEEFKNVRAKEVEIEGARALVREKSISHVRKAMLGIVDPSQVEVFRNFWA